MEFFLFFKIAVNTSCTCPWSEVSQWCTILYFLLEHLIQLMKKKKKCNPTFKLVSKSLYKNKIKKGGQPIAHQFTPRSNLGSVINLPACFGRCEETKKRFAPSYAHEICTCLSNKYKCLSLLYVYFFYSNFKDMLKEKSMCSRVYFWVKRHNWVGRTLILFIGVWLACKK